MAETLTDLYRRNEVFWMGVSAVILGFLIPGAFTIGSIAISRLFTVTGGGLLITSVFVGIYRFLTPM